MTTRNQAALTLRAYADTLIDLSERQAQGWDKGTWRDDEPSHLRCAENTLFIIKRRIARDTRQLAILAR